jgi:peptide chain release factor 3
LVFRGVPSFAPEILRRIKLQDAMKAKKLKDALQQLAEEGVVQLFVPSDGSGAIVGVVGALQLDVLAERLQSEYGLPIGFEQSRFTICRWITSDDKTELQKFIDSHGSSIAHDLDGAPVFLAQSAFTLNYEIERWPAIKISDVKDYQVRDKAA